MSCPKHIQARVLLEKGISGRRFGYKGHTGVSTKTNHSGTEHFHCPPKNHLKIGSHYTIFSLNAKNFIGLFLHNSYGFSRDYVLLIFRL
jgi:hypothetical protein